MPIPPWRPCVCPGKADQATASRAVRPCRQLRDAPRRRPLQRATPHQSSALRGTAADSFPPGEARVRIVPRRLPTAGEGSCCGSRSGELYQSTDKHPEKPFRFACSTVRDGRLSSRTRLFPAASIPPFASAPAAPGCRGGAPPRSFPDFSRVREIGPPEASSEWTSQASGPRLPKSRDPSHVFGHPSSSGQSFRFGPRYGSPFPRRPSGWRTFSETSFFPLLRSSYDPYDHARLVSSSKR